MTVTIHVETQHGIANGEWREWALTATMRSDGSFYDWLHPARGGERLDIEDFARLAPDVDLGKLEDAAVDALVDAQSEQDAPWMLRADHAYDRQREREGEGGGR